MKITLKNINKIYSTKKKALQDINLEMESPNLIGLLGQNGAGKSTLMKLLVAQLLPTSGEILLDGVALTKKEKELKAMLGYLPQTFGLYEELRVWEFLDYISALKGIKNKKEEIERVIEETSLTEKRKAKIGSLSGGQKQRVGIAQALLGNPEFLIFDEPTVGLDPEERMKFRNLFSKTAQNKMVLLSTHIIEDVQAICNRILVIHKGNILLDGKPDYLIQKARGHVGIVEREEEITKEIYVTSRINTATGVSLRIVAEELPAYAKEVEATLEDAYLYCVMREEE